MLKPQVPWSYAIRNIILPGHLKRGFGLTSHFVNDTL